MRIAARGGLLSMPLIPEICTDAVAKTTSRSAGTAPRARTFRGKRRRGGIPWMPPRRPPSRAVETVAGFEPA
ncbi:hypothetical protein GCM10010358_19850 [Streptomyces minutiscleroticus]|uniref:Uncharacterized protein n=1 Tax=Streptomyces minutiscleroticus TaxID=68238 RepID=A0A918KKY7_9ACTN|nr:hypothetical protein GCM10010358_19850 [Streptomyces minutiscleroticus]